MSTLRKLFGLRQTDIHHVGMDVGMGMDVGRVLAWIFVGLCISVDLGSVTGAGDKALHCPPLQVRGSYILELPW